MLTDFHFVAKALQYQLAVRGLTHFFIKKKTVTVFTWFMTINTDKNWVSPNNTTEFKIFCVSPIFFLALELKSPQRQYKCPNKDKFVTAIYRSYMKEWEADFMLYFKADLGIVIMESTSDVKFTEMTVDDWHVRWQNRKIGFHKEHVHP